MNEFAIRLRSIVERKAKGIEEKKVIEHLVTDTYRLLALQYGEYFGHDSKEIYWKNACQQFCEILRKQLKAVRIDSTYKSVDVRKINPRARHHMYLSTESYYIDGTWQQFLQTIRRDTPVLILDKKNPARDLEKANVPRYLWFIYGA